MVAKSPPGGHGEGGWGVGLGGGWGLGHAESQRKQFTEIGKFASFSIRSVSPLDVLTVLIIRSIWLTGICLFWQFESD